MNNTECDTGSLTKHGSFQSCSMYYIYDFVGLKFRKSVKNKV